MSEAMQALMDQDKQGRRTLFHFLDRIQNAPDRGTGGVIQWTRDELHER
jgi:hypothetical protein